MMLRLMSSDTNALMDTHSLFCYLFFFPLPCSLCSCHGSFAHWQDMASTAPGGSTGRPAGHRSDSSHKAKGSVCTTGRRPADTLDRGNGALSLGPSLRSPWGSSSIFVPAWDRSVHVRSGLISLFPSSSFYSYVFVSTRLSVSPASCSFDQRKNRF